MRPCATHGDGVCAAGRSCPGQPTSRTAQAFREGLIGFNARLASNPVQPTGTESAPNILCLARTATEEAICCAAAGLTQEPPAASGHRSPHEGPENHTVAPTGNQRPRHWGEGTRPANGTTDRREVLPVVFPDKSFHSSPAEGLARATACRPGMATLALSCRENPDPC